ncbi:hypothetical protein CKO25_14420 [Thiocapsa imhoffii]|uniref:Zinc-ribbon domain-containing protein n=1 Tax=Thiocapsa imhoffii TaxID=382777 RepID=A0A9X0WJD8_9GAMM|nr:putative zinc-binding metallopeptidase [Thiocapsa imhoffii]MBK1645826.1 hypothetical protein [Thiocapsa imhoffii]
MKTFICQSCGQPVFFENIQCMRCGAVLGFLPDSMQLSALVDAGNGMWMSAPESSSFKRRRSGFFSWLTGDHSGRSKADPGAAQRYRKCLNYAEHQVCNWMVPADHPSDRCLACAPNRIVPNLARPGNLEKWARLERGKRRLMYGLLRLGLSIDTKQNDPAGGLAFDFLSSADARPDQPVMTGHAAGLITINVDEADPALRERTRLDMDEQYRTLIGHFRHEIGHYYWDTLIRDGGQVDPFRTLFGDEQADYGEAMQRYYDDGPPVDWQDRYITPYASAHPWEDWAETWAHYMHIIDTLETAGHFGIEVEWPLPDGSRAVSDPAFDPYDLEDFHPIVEHWLPLTFAINSLNRSMGQQDLYPFVLPQPAIDKMAYVHGMIRAAAKRS